MRYVTTITVTIEHNSRHLGEFAAAEIEDCLYHIVHNRHIEVETRELAAELSKVAKHVELDTIENEDPDA